MAAPAFDFARQLRDPSFRQHLVGAGYRTGMTVVTLEAGADWSYALQLVEGVPWPVLVARCDAGQPHGWHLRLFNAGMGGA